jgi:hypothetical protein
MPPFLNEKQQLQLSFFWLRKFKAIGAMGANTQLWGEAVPVAWKRANVEQMVQLLLGRLLGSLLRGRCRALEG